MESSGFIRDDGVVGTTTERRKENGLRIRRPSVSILREGVGVGWMVWMGLLLLLLWSGLISASSSDVGAGLVTEGEQQQQLQMGESGAGPGEGECYVTGEGGTCLDRTGDNCEDNHDLCEFWATEHDECTNNPKYMLQNCRKSCNVCQHKGDLMTLIRQRLLDRDGTSGGGDDDEPPVDETPYGVEQTVSEHGSHLTAIQKVVANMTNYMDTIVFVDNGYSKVKDTCRNRHRSCAYWAAIGECEANPKYMTMQCAPVCSTCLNIDFDSRCPFDPTIPTALNPGDLDELFWNLTTLPEFQQYGPVIHSMPKPPGAHDDDAGVEPITPKMSDDVREGPWVVTLENFLTAEECERLIELGAIQGYEQSADVGHKKFDGSFASHKNDRRTSTNAWCVDNCFEDPVTKTVLGKIENVTGIPDVNSEFLQLLKYEEGQFYRTHHDYIHHHTERQEGVRILTVFLYLNDVKAGGGTNFPGLKLTVMPKQGKALIWPSVKNSDPNAKDRRTEHQALAVEEGIKYGANAWIHQRDFKEPYSRSCH